MSTRHQCAHNWDKGREVGHTIDFQLHVYIVKTNQGHNLVKTDPISNALLLAQLRIKVTICRSLIIIHLLVYEEFHAKDAPL